MRMRVMSTNSRNSLVVSLSFGVWCLVSGGGIISIETADFVFHFYLLTNNF